MGAGRAGTAGYLLDANVLIDFQKAGELKLLPKLAVALGPLWVTDVTLKEVDGLTVKDCRRFRVLIHRVKTQELLQAVPHRGALSHADAVNFVLAQARSWTLVTNDRALQTVCARVGVLTLRSLALLIHLVRAGVITSSRAWSIGQSIRDMNPHSLPQSVMDNLQAELEMD